MLKIKIIPGVQEHFHVLILETEGADKSVVEIGTFLQKGGIQVTMIGNA